MSCTYQLSHVPNCKHLPINYKQYRANFIYKDFGSIHTKRPFENRLRKEAFGETMYTMSTINSCRTMEEAYVEKDMHRLVIFIFCCEYCVYIFVNLYRNCCKSIQMSFLSIRHDSLLRDSMEISFNQQMYQESKKETS